MEKDEKDIKEIVTAQSQELMTEDFKRIQTKNREPKAEIDVSSNALKVVLLMWENVSDFVEKKHSKKIPTGCTAILFNDTCGLISEKF